MRRQILCCIALIATSGALSADQLHLKNGSLIIGKLVNAAEDRVVFETPFAGNITIQQQNIERITTEEPVTLRMADGTVYENRQICPLRKVCSMVEANRTSFSSPTSTWSTRARGNSGGLRLEGARDDLRRI